VREAEGDGTVSPGEEMIQGDLMNMYKYLMTQCKEDNRDSVVPSKITRRNWQK